MELKKACNILGVSENSSPEEIEEAYQTELRKNPFVSDKDSELMEAYSLLINEHQKNPPKKTLASARPDEIINHPIEDLIEKINRK